MDQKAAFKGFEQGVKELEKAGFGVKRFLDVPVEREAGYHEAPGGSALSTEDLYEMRLTLSDVINSRTIQSLMENFYSLTNIGVAIIDLQGKILVATGWQDICTKFHRVHPDTARNCLESDLQLSKGVEPGTFRLYRCKNNMWDMATPITVGSRPIGNIYLGQFLFEDEKPDLSFFRSQAEKYGFNEEQYLSVLQRVPRWSHQTVQTAMTFYARFAQMVSDLSYSNLRLSNTLEQKDKLTRLLSESEERYRSIIENQQDLVSRFTPDGTFLYVNDAYCRLFGKTRDQLVGKKWHPMLVEDDLSYVLEQLKRLSPSNPTVTIENRIISDKHGVQWVQFINTGFFDDDGHLKEIQSVGRDITARKVAEIELQRTLDATTDGIWAWNFKTNELFFSPRYYTMLGYEPNEFPADHKNWRNQLHPDDRENAVATASEYLKTKPDHYENEFRLRTKDGGYRWIHSQASVVERDEHGDALYMIGNHEDITERREFDNKLSESEEKFRGIYQQSPVAIEIYDAEGFLIDANPQCLKLFGINDLDEVKDFKLFDDPNLPQGAREDLLRGISVHYEHEFDFDLIKDKGLYDTSRSGKAFISVHITPLFYPNNESSGYLVQVENITEQKRAEEALRQSETYFREITENASDIIVIVDEKGIIGYTSPSMERFLGYSPKELTGKSIFDFIHSDDIQRVVKDFTEAIQSDTTPIPNSFRVLHKNGSERVLEGLGKNLLHHPTLSGFIMNIHDVTESRRLQSQLQQAQRMESIATFTGGIAHDYNNLLSIIMGNLGLAQQDAKPGSDQAEFLTEAEKAARKVGDLTHELMSLSRGGGPIKELVPIAETLNRVTLEIPVEKNISVEKSIPDELWPVPHDARKMGAVFRNVMKNALEAMPDGGSLTLDAQNLRVEDGDAVPGLSVKPGDYVRITIQDSGSGISEENLDKIFDPYFSTKPMGVQKGMGLGLATAHAIVKGHGGDIIVQSTPDVGTTVHIYLPATGAGEAPRVAGNGEIGPQSTIDNQQSPIQRVLLMDDEEMLRNLGQQMLNRLGYAVDTAGDGLEAIAMYQKQMDSKEPYDAIILDLTIKGGMGGEQTLRELLKVDPHVKAVVASGYFNDPVMEDFQDYGFKAAMAKPYEMKDLKRAIEKALSVEN